MFSYNDVDIIVNTMMLMLTARLRPRTHRNIFLRFCIVSSNELVVLDSLENSKQYKNAGKRFRAYGALFALLNGVGDLSIAPK